jgi:hypothetical protein
MKRIIVLGIVITTLAACASNPAAPAVVTEEGVVRSDGLIETDESTDTTTLDDNQEAAQENAPSANIPDSTGGETLGGATETFAGDTYAFDYPVGWFVSGDGAAATLTSFDAEGETDATAIGVTTDQTLITFNSTNGTLQENADTLLTELARGGNEVLTEGAVQLPTGAEAYRVQYVDASRGEMVALFTEVADQALVVQGYGNLIVFDNIINTLRPVDPDALVEDGQQPGATQPAAGAADTTQEAGQ